MSKQRSTKSRASSTGKRTTGRPARRTNVSVATKPTARAAKESGSDSSQKAVEASRRALRNRVAKDRRDRISAFKQGLKLSARKSRVAKATVGAQAPARLRVLAEGDSWFDYPFEGGAIPKRLQESTDIRLLNLAHAGDEAREMLGVEQRIRLETNLADPSLQFDALLFSGGGNDLIGNPFCLWLRKKEAGMKPADALDPVRLRDALDIVEMAYRDLVKIREEKRNRCVLFVHGYDFPEPTGKPVCGLGPWLKPSLDYRGWTDPMEAFEIVKALLRTFDALLQKLAVEFRDFVYIRTQGTLNPKTEWANEIHPNRTGFGKITAEFRAALEQQFPGRIGDPSMTEIPGRR